MRLRPYTLTLKDGRSALIRSAAPKDAAAVSRHMEAVRRETPYLIETAGEVSASTARRALLLRQRERDGGAITLCALVKGELCAMSTLSPYGRLFRTAHRATMSITVEEGFWGLGLGKALTEELVRFARAAGYSSIELSVDNENTRAIGLYEHFGFVPCGLIPAALRQADGSFHDELLMIKPLS